MKFLKSHHFDKWSVSQTKLDESEKKLIKHYNGKHRYVMITFFQHDADEENDDGVAAFDAIRMKN